MKTLALLILVGLASLALGEVIFRTMRTAFAAITSVASVASVAPVASSQLNFFRRSALTVLGLGVLANVWQFMALSAGLTRASVTITLLLPIAVMGAFVFQELSLKPALTAVKSSIQWVCSERWRWWILILMTLILAAVGSLSIGRAVSGDGEVQNFALGKVVGESGSLLATSLPGPYSFRLFLGLTGEMGFAGLIALGSVEAAKLLDWPLLLLAVISLVGICARVGLSCRSRWLAAFIFLAGPGVAGLLSSGKVDLFSMTLAFAAVYWAVEARDDDGPAPFFFANLLAAFAIVGKLSYAIPLAVVILCTLLWFARGRLRLRAIEFVGWSALACALGFAPFFIKNFVLFADPLATFHDPLLAPLMHLKLFNDSIAHHVLATWPLAIALMPTNDNLSVLFPVSLPMILLFSKRQGVFSKPLWAVTIISILAQLTWIALRANSPAWRYMYPAFILFFPIVAVALEHLLSDRSRSLRPLRITVMVIILLCFLRQLENWRDFGASLERSLTYFRDSSSTPCQWAGANCEPFRELNQIAKNGARVFVAADSRFQLRSDLIQCSSTTEESGLGPFRSDLIFADLPADERWRRLYAEGFEYLVYENRAPYLNVFQSLQIEIPPLGVRLIRLFDDGQSGVYRIEFSDLFAAQLSSASRPRHCQPIGIAKAWHVVER